MTKARTKAQKRRNKAARAAMPEIAPIERAKQGRARMAEIAANVPALLARARIMGKEIPKDRKGRSALLREMSAPWYGCRAGRVIAAYAPPEERPALWDAICHMRRVQTAYDRACGAPNRHAQCLRLLAPVDALHADADSPPADLRTPEERDRQAVSAWMQMQGWLDRAKAEAGECKGVVLDDERCTRPDDVMAGLRAVVAGMKGD